MNSIQQSPDSKSMLPKRQKVRTISPIASKPTANLCVLSMLSQKMIVLFIVIHQESSEGTYVAIVDHDQHMKQ